MVQSILQRALLDLSFKRCIEDNKSKLLSEAKTFGLCFLGDGATVKKLPLVNVLGSTANIPPVVLEIHDCHAHMASGGRKDAPYISSIFFDHLEELDPNKNLTDVLFFDGAKNVQKAGEIIEAKYPRVTCLHGAEHCISLFFDDISKLKQIKVSTGIFV